MTSGQTPEPQVAGQPAIAAEQEAERAEVRAREEAEQAASSLRTDAEVAARTARLAALELMERERVIRDLQMSLDRTSAELVETERQLEELQARLEETAPGPWGETARPAVGKDCWPASIPPVFATTASRP